MSYIEQAGAEAAKRNYAQARDFFNLARKDDPSNADAHVGYASMTTIVFIDWDAPGGPKVGDEAAMKQAADDLLDEYRTLITENPENPALYYTLGVIDKSDGALWIQRGLEVAPTDPKLLGMAGVHAQKSGDNAGHLRFLTLARDANPEDPGPAFSWAWAQKGTERVVALLAFAERFPESDRVEQAKFAALDGADTELRAALLAELSSSDSYIGQAAADLIFEELLVSDPLAAADYARARSDTPRRSGSWADLAEFAAAMADPSTGSDAVCALRPPDGTNPVPLHVKKIRSLGSDGRIEEAETASVEALLEESDPEIWDAINDSGVNPESVLLKLAAARRDAGADPAELNLEHALTGENITLESRRGKVVLLNFFYPGCGPCRNEFTYLSPLARSFATEPFEVIAVNINETEASLVAPFVNGNGYPFTPVQATGEWARDAYGVTAAPTNLLIDHTGRVIGKPRLHDSRTEARLRSFIREAISAAQLEGASA